MKIVPILSTARLVALSLVLLVGAAVLSLQAQAQGISHEVFDKILRANVKDGRVNYPGIAADASFKDYLAALAAAPAPRGKTEQLVFYINAYNALAIDGILRGLSPSSYFGRQRFFKRESWKVAGQDLTLDHIEHKIIRPLGDARIHFAVICASHSCPKLRAEAYTLDRLEAQLEDNTRKFLADTERNRFDKAGKSAQVSEIFKWFSEDFVKNAGSVEKYLAKYVADADIAKGLQAGEYKIGHIDYDWSLNGTPPKK